MEWSDFNCSPLAESLYCILSPPPLTPPPPQLQPQPQPQPPQLFEMAEEYPEWTFEENKVFEDALAELDHSSPNFFENMATMVPWRSIEDIKLHYEALLHDIELIESGNYPIPDYPSDLDSRPNEPLPHKDTKSGQPRRRGIPWTEEEHQLFLMGLNKYGKGGWRSISRYYVITKTPTQVASHAQKYFRRQTSSTPPDRRRPSIHDIHTVTPAAAAFTSAALPIHHHQSFPFQHGALYPTLHQTYNPAGRFFDQNQGFLPPVTAAMFNPAANYASTSSSTACYFPSLTNQYWG